MTVCYHNSDRSIQYISQPTSTQYYETYDYAIVKHEDPALLGLQPRRPSSRALPRPIILAPPVTFSTC